MSTSWFQYSYYLLKLGSGFIGQVLDHVEMVLLTFIGRLGNGYRHWLCPIQSTVNSLILMYSKFTDLYKGQRLG